MTRALFTEHCCSLSCWAVEHCSLSRSSSGFNLQPVLITHFSRDCYWAKPSDLSKATSPQLLCQPLLWKCWIKYSCLNSPTTLQSLLSLNGICICICKMKSLERRGNREGQVGGNHTGRAAPPFHNGSSHLSYLLLFAISGWASKSSNLQIFKSSWYIGGAVSIGKNWFTKAVKWGNNTATPGLPYATMYQVVGIGLTYFHKVEVCRPTLVKVLCVGLKLNFSQNRGVCSM